MLYEKLGGKAMVKKGVILVIVTFVLLLFTACVDNYAEEAARKEWRQEYINFAIQLPADRIVLVGDVEVSLTGIAFSLENRTDLGFNYGEPWELAYYADGHWMPVPYLPEVSDKIWVCIGFSLQSGGIQQYRQDWDWLFGELLPGRYMFIRDGWLGDWHPIQDRIYVRFEFHITEDSPVYLPPVSNDELPSIINLVEYGNITPNGMFMVIENVSPYDIDHRVQILAMVPERYAQSDYWWEWRSLPHLPVEGDWDHIMQGEGFLPSGGQLEFSLDWAIVFGELPPGEYRVVLDMAGQAHPPHPTGWARGEIIVISFTI